MNIEQISKTIAERITQAVNPKPGVEFDYLVAQRIVAEVLREAVGEQDESIMMPDGPVWNRGAFDDGYAARIHDCDRHQSPSPDTIGHYAYASWHAGWIAAHTELETKGKKQ